MSESHLIDWLKMIQVFFALTHTFSFFWENLLSWHSGLFIYSFLNFLFLILWFFCWWNFFLYFLYFFSYIYPVEEIVLLFFLGDIIFRIVDIFFRCDVTFDFLFWLCALIFIFVSLLFDIFLVFYGFYVFNAGIFFRIQNLYCF